MKTKILSLFLVLCLSMGLFIPAIAEENETAEIKYEREMSVLCNMGILESETAEKEFVSRGDFIAATVKLMGIDSFSEENSVFTDVKENVGPINAAASMGIISGAGDGNFYPDNAITAEQAVKILVCALGYEVKTGKVYPAGYLTVGTQIGLLSGVDTDASFSWDIAAKMLYNAANIEIFQSDLNGGYKTEEGVTPITKWLGYDIYEGVILANDTAYIKGSVAPSDKIYVNSTELFDENKLVSQKIGHSMILYCQEERVMAYYDKEREKVTSVYADDLLPERTSATSFAYYKGDVIAYMPVESDASFIYNGKNTTFSKSILPEIGMCEFIDINGNGRADAVKIKDSMSYVVQSVNTNLDVIWAEGIGAIKIDEDVQLIGRDGIIDLGVIKENDVISISQSLDGEMKTIEVSTVKRKMKIKEISDREIICENGKAYKYISDEAVLGFQVGAVVYAYFDADNYIVGSSLPKIGGLYYGYLIDGMYENGLGGYDATMRIFDVASQEIVNYGISQKITINDKNQDIYKRELNPKRTIESFMSGGKVSHQLIKFSLDDKGYINRIYKAVDNTALPFESISEFSLDYKHLGDSSVTSSYVGYYSEANVVNSDLSLQTATCIQIPELEDGEKLIDREKEIAVVNPVTAWVNPYHRVYDIKVYDMDNDRQAGVVVRALSGGSSSVEVAMPYFYIDSVSKVLRDEDSTELVTKVYGYYKGNYVGYISSEKYSETFEEEVKTLKRGDVCRIAENYNGEIINIMKVFSITGKKDGYLMHANASNDFRMETDELLYKQSGKCNWNVKNVALHGNVTKVKNSYMLYRISDSLPDKYIPISNSCKVVVYDEEEDKLSLGDISDIDPYSDKQTAFLRIYLLVANEIYVINRKAPIVLTWEGLY